MDEFIKKKGIQIFYATGCCYSSNALKMVGTLRKNGIKVSVKKVGHITDSRAKTRFGNKLKPHIPRNKRQYITWPQVFNNGSYLGGYEELLQKFG